jgi:hypothetical protein
MRKNLGVAPSGTTDAVTKAYVDAAGGFGSGTVAAMATLTGDALAANDEWIVLDVSDTSGSAGGTLKTVLDDDVIDHGSAYALNSGVMIDGW